MDGSVEILQWWMDEYGRSEVPLALPKQLDAGHVVESMVASLSSDSCKPLSVHAGGVVNSIALCKKKSAPDALKERGEKRNSRVAE